MAARKNYIEKEWEGRPRIREAIRRIESEIPVGLTFAERFAWLHQEVKVIIATP